MFNKNAEFAYTIDPEFDHIIEEKGNVFMAFRKIKWGDSDTYKLDLRKYIATEDGGERMGKGCTFISDEGAQELTRVLLSAGYGRDDELLETIKQDRPSLYHKITKDILNVVNDDESEDDTLFNIKEAL